MDKSKDVDGSGVGGDMHEKQSNVDRVVSVGEGQVEEDVEKLGSLHRTLTPRLIHVRVLRFKPRCILFANTFRKGHLPWFERRQWSLHCHGQGSGSRWAW